MTTEYNFETHEPVDLTVETGKGIVDVTCTDTTESTVVVEGTGRRRGSRSARTAAASA